jgi:hypothetical protein
VHVVPHRPVVAVSIGLGLLASLGRGEYLDLRERKEQETEKMHNEKLQKGLKKRDRLGNIGAGWRGIKLILKKRDL